MIKSILSSPQETVLQNALSVSAMRHKLLSNNIANVNTPGFKRSDVASFDNLLTAAMNQNQSSLSRTNARHFPGEETGEFTPNIVTSTNTSLRTDGNNVDIDSEMANLAENTIYYDAVAQTLSQYYSNLYAAIKEGR